MTSLLQKHFRLLTWLRYSLWVVLYPVGLLCEGIHIYHHSVALLSFSSKQNVSPIIFYSFTYSVSFFISGLIVYNSIPYAEKTGRLSLQLPNTLNFLFDFSWFLRLYILLLIFGKLKFYTSDFVHSFLTFFYLFGKSKKNSFLTVLIPMKN